jgi:hypothetical protein
MVIGVAILTALGWQRNILAALSLNVIALVIVLAVASRSRRPVTGRQSDLPPIEVV